MSDKVDLSVLVVYITYRYAICEESLLMRRAQVGKQDLRSVVHMSGFFFQAEDGIRDLTVTGVQTCALPIYARLQAQLAGRLGCCIALLARKRVESDSDEGRARERLASDFNAFGGELKLADEDAGHVAAGMREIRHITFRKRIEIDGQERDRLTVRGGKRGTQRRLVSHREEHVGLARRELAIVSVVAFDSRGLDVIEGKVAALLITKFGHPPEEICIMLSLSRLHTDKADAQHLMLLRARRERPRHRRAAEQRDALAPSHSITSSASASNFGEISMPSAFAALS